MAADRRSAILVCVHLSLTGCAVPTLDLTGKACDAAHPCVAGFECVSGSCVSSAATDGGSLECDAGLGACTPSTTQACGTDIGECQAGSQTCSSDGQWGTCVGSVGPAGEVCDGKDNDCNGGTDEWQSLSTSLCPLQLGVCAGSIQSCWAGEEQPCDEFSYGESYEADRERSCDALDNDCDGQTDEGLDDDADGWGVVVRCTAGRGDCDDRDRGVNPGVAEVCNGVDDDCDGQTDEAWPLLRIPLGGPTPTTPSIAGIPGKGFVVVYGTSDAPGTLHLQLIEEPENQLGAKVEVAAGAAVSPAMTASHLLWGDERDELHAKELQNGLPAGETIVTPVGPEISKVAALSGRSTGQSFAVLADDHMFVSLLLDGRTSSDRAGHWGAFDSPPAFGLARVAEADWDALVVFADGDELAAARMSTPQGLLIAVPWSPASLTVAHSPSGAGKAVAFVGKAGTTERVYIGRALDSRLEATDYAALSVAGTVSAPALAALGDSTWLVAWLQKSGMTTVANWTRISWDEVNGWGAPSAVQGFTHLSDPTAEVVEIAAASDESSFMVLTHTRGTAGDELFAWTECPAR